MKILVTGSDGQLGQCLQSCAPESIQLSLANRSTCDVSKPDELRSYLQSCDADVIINAACFTAVDLAETQPELARQVNVDAVETLARHCAATGAFFVQVSSDYVFDGRKTMPYLPADKVLPLNIYGETKADAETATLELCPRSAVVRSSWSYSEYANNFFTTMLRLAGTHDELSVVDDQTGSPTYAGNLARMIWTLVEHGFDEQENRIWHWADQGEITWFDFASAIFMYGLELGLLERCPVLTPISTEQYGAPAQRPRYSALNTSQTESNLGIAPVSWRESLQAMLLRQVPRQQLAVTTAVTTAVAR